MKKIILNKVKINNILKKPYYAKYKNYIIETANELIQNRLIFNHKWDMEPTNNYVDYGDVIDWNKKHNNDDEYVFMKNRHNFWVIIAQAYFITNDKKYVKSLVVQINSWLKNRYDKNGLESKTNRCLDKGIRMSNWIKIISLINESPYFNKGQLFSKMEKCMQEHALEMLKNYPPHHQLSNHGLIQNQGLLMLRFHFSHWKIWNKEVDKKLINRIDENARLQILSDGIHWEQSPLYHCWSTLSFLQIKKYAKLLRFSLKARTNENIEKLCWGIIKFIKPNKKQPTQSDSDDTNVQDILVRAAIEFNSGHFKKLGFKKLDFDTLLDYGIKGVKKYKKIKSRDIPFQSIECHASGNYYLRTGFELNDNYLTFRNGQYGSGHAHCDPNHFTIFANGQDWIVNTGRYTYKPNKDRELFKSAKYHNTQIINDVGATITNGSWTFKKIATTIKIKPYFSKNVDYISGLNLGFLYDENPTVPRRDIIFVKPNYWFIYDTFYSKYKNKIELNFHIEGDVKIIKQDNDFVLSKNNKKFKIHQLSEDIVSIVKKGKISKHYNQIQDSQIISQNIVAKKIFNIANVFESNIQIKKIVRLKLVKSDGVILEEYEANAWKIIFNKSDYDIIFIANIECHNGKKMYTINDYNFYAKKIVLRYKNNILQSENIIEY